MAGQFGPEVAVGLKDAIVRTEGLTLVSSQVAHPGVNKLLLGFQGDNPQALAPGEVLFVALEEPAYDVDALNEGRAAIERNVTDGKIRHSIDGSVDERRGTISLGSLRFEEKGPEPIVQTSTSTYSAEDPYLQEFLNNDGKRVGEVYQREIRYAVLRMSTVVVYPSILFARVAAQMKYDTDHTPITQRHSFNEGLDGAITKMSTDTFRRIARSEDEPVALHEYLVQRYAPVTNSSTHLGEYLRV